MGPNLPAIQAELDRLRQLISIAIGGHVNGVAGTGFWHSTGGALDPNADHGTAPAQIPIVNAGVTDAPFTPISGDVALAPSGLTTVEGLQGFALSPAQALNLLVVWLGAWPVTDTHASSPVTLTTSSPLHKFDTSGGAIQYLTPLVGTLFDGMVIGLKPSVASATPATLHPQNAGETVENPSNSGSFVGDAVIPGQGPACFWKYEAATKKWIGFINV